MMRSTIQGAVLGLAWVTLSVFAQAQPAITVSPVVNTSTAIPGGTGTFTSLSPPAVNYGNLAFLGSGVEGQQGVYLDTTPVPVPIKVADTTTLVPGGVGTFSGFGAVGH